MTEVLRSTPRALENSSLWLGVPNLSESMLKTFDPAYTGHVQIFVVRSPKIFTKFYPDTHDRRFKVIMERTSLSATGIPELTANSQNQTHGFADRFVPHFTYSELPFDTLTIRLLEFKGLPVYTMIRDWIENMGDPVSKIQDYKGRAGSGADQLEYSLENHTASFIIVTTDETHQKIQGRAHYITAATPAAIPSEHYNWNAGEIGIVEGYDVAFRGVLKYGNYIDMKAQELLNQRNAAINYIAEKNDAKNWTGVYGL